MDQMARVSLGLTIFREYVNHSHVEPSHDILEVWVDKPINPDVVAFLEHIGWYRENEIEEDRFYFFT